MNRPLRRLWALVAIGGATAVGIITHEPGFVVITLLGGLWLPRLLGLTGSRWGGHKFGAWGCAGPGGRRHGLQDRLDTWHREAHGSAGGSQPPSTSGAAQI